MNLLKLLDRPIAFHRCLIEAAGSVNAALMLSQAIYWHNRTSDPDGWFYKTVIEWESEIGLTRHEQMAARKKLRESGFWEEARNGRPPKLYFRIDGEKLLKTLSKPENKTSGKRTFKTSGKRTSKHPESGHLKHPDSGHSSLLHIDYMDRDYTETTHTPRNAGAGVEKKAKILPPKPQSNNQHPMANVYRDAFGFNALNRTQCDLIADQVTNELAWRAVLTSRASRGWNPRNVNAALVDYQRIISGETIEQIHGGNHERETGKPKQSVTYETAGQRRSRKFHERMEAGAREIAEIRARRLDTDESAPDGVTPARRLGT